MTGSDDDNVRPLRPQVSVEDAAEMFAAIQPKRQLSDGGVVQYLVHPALRPALDEWLISRGLRIDLLPLDDDSLPTYLIAPGDELMRLWEDR